MKRKISEKYIGELLEKLNSSFKKYGCVFWLEFGSLLGKVRENRIIAWDGDMDLAIDYDNWKPQIIDELKRNGFIVSKPPNYITDLKILDFIGRKKINALTQIKFRYKGVKVSFEIYHRGVGKYENIMFFWPSPKPDYLVQIPVEFMFPQIKSKFYGVEISIPKNYEKNLKFMYGEDWMIPDPKYINSAKHRKSGNRFKFTFKYDKMLKKQRPVLDKQGKFMFFGNHKAGLISVNRNILKDRIINWKNFREKYLVELEKYMDEEFEKIFKFTIIRNPYSRIVSAFFYLKGEGILGQGESFQEFVKTDLLKEGLKINLHFHSQFLSAFYNGTQFVNYIARLENIDEDWKYIASKINCSSKLPHKNKTNHKPYQEYYDEETKEIVTELYKEDINLFGYKFGE
jgi:phosphorylcholine metabolism protein LicD